MFATKEQVEILKRRAKIWEVSGCRGGDPLIKEIMPLLNQIPNVAVVWSCEGHDAGENFYIMFAIEESAFQPMLRMYESLCDRLIPYQLEAEPYYAAKAIDNAVSIPDTFSKLQYLEFTFAKRKSPIDMDWYNVMNLYAQTDKPGAKAIFFKEFKEVLTTVVSNIQW